MITMYTGDEPAGKERKERKENRDRG